MTAALFIAIAAILILAACGQFQLHVEIDEDKDGCRMASSGSDFSSMQEFSDGCIRWVGEKCTILYGTQCDDLIELTGE